MIIHFKNNWKIYLKEALAIGVFMFSACFFVILFEYPSFWGHAHIASAFLRRSIVGLAMGLTAIALIYSPLGKQSGAHMNPAVSLANYQLDRITLHHLVWYIFMQFLGASLAVLIVKWMFYTYISHPAINYIVTVPKNQGYLVAFFAEFLISFILLIVVLIVGNSRFKKYTGICAGILVFVFISLEAPQSGMSMNPARSFGSAFASNIWDGWWIYWVAPIIGMQLAAFIYRKIYLIQKRECKSLKFSLTGNPMCGNVYKVNCWYEMTSEGKKIQFTSND